MSRTINVSPSLLADVMTCETKGWVRHVKGFTSKGDAIKAVAGSAFHAGIAAYLDPRDEGCPAGSVFTASALETFHRVYDPAFARLLTDDLPDQAYLPANLHRVLARWLEMHPPHALPWKRVLTVEEAFVSRSWTFGDTTIRLICRPDITAEDSFERIRWVDTKTTGWRIADSGWRHALRMSLQVALYTDAVIQKHGPERAAMGGWINAIEMRTLPSDPSRKCATHKVPYAECGNEHAKYEFIECMTTPERVARALLDAEEAAQRFVQMMEWYPEMLNMHGGANGACRFCPAGEWCAAGRIPDALPSFMYYEPWVVEEGVR